MTREPKDYEIWYVKLPDGSIKPAVAFIPTSAENTVWYIDGDTCCADPIAPVLSHELVTELVKVLAFIAGCELRPVNAGEVTVTTPITGGFCVEMARAALAKVQAAGLDVQS